MPKKCKGIHSHRCAYTQSYTYTRTHSVGEASHQPCFICIQVFSQGWWCWSDHPGVLQCGGQSDVGYCHQSVHLKWGQINILDGSNCKRNQFCINVYLEFILFENILFFLPERLKLDWWRLRIGGGWWEVGEVLADGEGVMYLGVGATSYTGPSYIPRVTPCLRFTWAQNRQRHKQANLLFIL